MEDGRIPKDLLYSVYGELAIGTRPTGGFALRFKDVCKFDMKACHLNPANLKQNSYDHLLWRSAVKAGIKKPDVVRERTWEDKKTRQNPRLNSADGGCRSSASHSAKRLHLLKVSTQVLFPHRFTTHL